MKKLTLRVDDLQVLSFDTAEVQAEQGTVDGHMHTHGLTCGKPCPDTWNLTPTSPCVCIG